MMYRRILVAIDGGPASAAALEEAIALAKLHHAYLRLVHVIDWPLPLLEVVPHPETLRQVACREGWEVLVKAIAVARQASIEPEAKVVESLGRRRSQALVEEARRWPADLIVLGTHGRSSRSHVAESVVGNSRSTWSNVPSCCRLHCYDYPGSARSPRQAQKSVWCR